MYDYYLGGYHNFAIDRQAAERAIAVNPGLPLVTQANRAFLRRAVRYLAAQGIDQFLDIGSGIPTVGNVHEVAQGANPAARVVYVDSDHIAVAHSQAILAGNSQATVLLADARQPETIIDAPVVRQFLRFERPVGVLLLAVLHFITDDALAATTVRMLRDVLAPGSFLVISHAAVDSIPPSAQERMMRVYSATTNPIKPRSNAQILALCEGMTFVEPGLVYLPLWRPEGLDDLLLDDPGRCHSAGGVARKA